MTTRVRWRFGSVMRERYCGVNVKYGVRIAVVCSPVPSLHAWVWDPLWDPLYQGVERVVRTTLNEAGRWPVYEAFFPAEHVNEME